MVDLTYGLISPFFFEKKVLDQGLLLFYCKIISSWRKSQIVCFVALRPKSTAMVIAGRSVHLTTLCLGKLEQAVNQYFVHILKLVTENNPI